MGTEKYNEIPFLGNIHVDRDEYFSMSFRKRREVYGTKIGGEVRVLTIRGSFIDVFDGEGTIQLFIDKDLRKEFVQNEGLNFNAGDFLGIGGVITESGQKSQIVAVHSLVINNRSVVPLNHDSSYPELNPFTKAMRTESERRNLIKSQGIVRQIESYLDNDGFTKVITSSFERVDAGLNSKPFKVEGTTLLLRRDFDVPTRAYVPITSKVYQLGFVFHNEGVSDKNRHEFLLGQVFGWGTINEGEKVAVKVVSHVLESNGKKVEKFERIDYFSFIKRFNPDFSDELLDKGRRGERLNTIEIQGFRRTYRKSKRSVENPLIIEGCLIQDALFAKTDHKNANLSQDFRLIWQGRTIFHGSAEISSFTEQIKRYELVYGANYQASLSEGEKHYLEMLRYGFPTYWGLSISVDLLTQIALDIKDVGDLRPTIA